MRERRLRSGGRTRSAKMRAIRQYRDGVSADVVISLCGEAFLLRAEFSAPTIPGATFREQFGEFLSR